ncbi:PREDICTED: SH3 domain-containing protein 19-like isoform X4 [Dinoponera quadriceps]|uniref:SH3 domain-containing protein 19-like isoform X4 n=1 Tax=Dinoponera quadriceps TaxID=609295 RepID=A0A6P3XEZ1_DINQU|nr:PREDICTED: SH3 domain-containing protein 19-like isoform X4 [Dinoponera quadriceps]
MVGVGYRRRRPSGNADPDTRGTSSSRRDTKRPDLGQQARPTELLTNFFGRKKQENSLLPRATGQLQNPISQLTNSTTAVSLIDLSPPGSPTFTTRSSSDGVSVDSFGSDGNSNPSVFTSSGNTSQTESAFEDDFDFFGLSAKRTAQNDPWQVKTAAQDPFGPLEDTCSNVTRTADDTCLFSLRSNANCVANQVPSIQTVSKPAMTSMPTIIRARPPKPPAPKILMKKLEPMAKETCTADYKISNNGTTSKPLTLSVNVSDGTADKPLTLDFSNMWFNAWSNDDDSPSPPMPTIPPPAPPADYLAELNGDLGRSSDKPYGIALYDFPATHPDDLPLKEGDVVQLVRKINDDWLEGRIRNRQGIFPFNFIDIKIPLPGLPDNVVTALYTFQGESSDDLSFEEGAKITVISRISEDWLYGEYNGRKGQFPANHVNRFPRNI